MVSDQFDKPAQKNYLQPGTRTMLIDTFNACNVIVYAMFWMLLIYSFYGNVVIFQKKNKLFEALQALRRVQRCGGNSTIFYWVPLGLQTGLWEKEGSSQSSFCRRRGKGLAVSSSWPLNPLFFSNRFSFSSFCSSPLFVHLGSWRGCPAISTR